MKSNLTNEDLVSRYLDNEMTEGEKLDFERRLEADPQLKNEFNFQNDLVTSIREYRRMELKARLAHIDVPAPFMHAIGLKIAAIASATIILGTGIYFAIQNQTAPEPAVIDLSAQHVTIEEENIPQIPEVEIKPVTVPDATEKIVKKKKKKKRSEEKDKTVKKERKVTQPVVVKPDMNIEFEDELADEVNAEENPEVAIKEIESPAESKMGIETIIDRRHKFHYKFYNNRLYLLGDFSKSPYEIIELNSKSGKKYFLCYENNFYKLETNRQKPTPLHKVENDSIIKELSIIQKYK